MSRGIASIAEPIVVWHSFVFKVLCELLESPPYPSLKALILLRRVSGWLLDDVREELIALLSADPESITEPAVRADVVRLIGKTAPSRSTVAIAAVVEWLLRRSGACR
jgi:hypothetical protein